MTPTVAGGLTMAQARAASVGITGPFNAAVAAINRDVADGAPGSQFRAGPVGVKHSSTLASLAQRRMAGVLLADRLSEMTNSR